MTYDEIMARFAYANAARSGLLLDLVLGRIEAARDKEEDDDG